MTIYRLGKKDLQATYLTKDKYVDHIKNSQNSTVKKKIKLENG